MSWWIIRILFIYCLNFLKIQSLYLLLAGINKKYLYEPQDHLCYKLYYFSICYVEFIIVSNKFNVCIVKFLSLIRKKKVQVKCSIYLFSLFFIGSENIKIIKFVIKQFKAICAYLESGDFLVD